MKPSIEVCLSTHLIDLCQLEDKNVVIIDIFRATSTMVAALSNNIPAILPTSDLETCRSYKSKGYLLAGERKGVKPDDFDFCNSPLAYLDNRNIQKVVMTTTNGTLAIEKSRIAKKIIIGSFLNLDTVINYLKKNANDTLLFCAGWCGIPNLEDTLFAGAVLEGIKDDFQYTDDNCFIAETLYSSHKADLLGFLQTAVHFQRLIRLGHQDDAEFSLTFNKFDVLPTLQGQFIKLEH